MRRTSLLLQGLVVVVVTSMALGGVALADKLNADADADALATAHPNSLTANQAEGTTVAYDLSALVDETGNASDDVFPGTVTVTITRSGAWLAAVPGSPASFSFTSYDTSQAGTLRVTVPACTEPGTQETMTAVLTAGTSTNGKNLNPASVTLSYIVTATAGTSDCEEVNTPPSVSFTNPPTSADEGDTKTFDFSITDAEGGPFDLVAGYPDCGSSNGTPNEVVGTPTITGSTGTFDCRFVDGDGTATVGVRVSDAGDLLSDVAMAEVTVANVTPDVDAPAFTTTSIDCRTSVALAGIGFSDPGVADDDWTIDTDWGDGATDSTTTATQGAQANQSHQYDTPGVYSATIDVTDKDGATGTAVSSNSVTVNQTYTVDFLPPFDDSTPSGLIVNKMKNGRVVPVKVVIYDDCAQTYVTAGSVTIMTTKTAGVGIGDPIETYADAGQSSAGTNAFRWSADPSAPGGGFWIYNLDSKALGLVVNNLYRVDVSVDGTKATVDTWAVLQPVK